MMVYEKKHRTLNQLAAHYKRGERKALEELIRRFHPTMKRIILFHTKLTDPVEDIAQDCWHDILNKLEAVDLTISFEAWATTIVRHKAIDWIRRQQRLRKKNRIYQREYEPATENNTSTHDNEDKQMKSKLERVQNGIDNLPPTQKMVLTMFYMENLSLQEISRVLDIPEGTVKSRLYHAREDLKKLVKT